MSGSAMDAGIKSHIFKIKKFEIAHSMIMCNLRIVQFTDCVFQCKGFIVCNFQIVQLLYNLKTTLLTAGQDENAKAGKFGFAVDNTIGGTPQPNGWMDNWVDFFRERRLLHQLRLAGDPKLNELGRRLADNLDKFFEDVEVGLVS